MKKADNISDRYRKEVNELIDNQSEFNLISPLVQDEADEIWEEISNEMDLADVWNDISSDLDRVMPKDPVSGIIPKSIAIGLIILIGAIFVKKAILDSDIVQQNVLIEKKENEQTTGLILKNIPVHFNKGDQIKTELLPVLSKSYDKNKVGIETNPAKSNIKDLNSGKPIPVYNAANSKDLVTPDMVDLNLIHLRQNIPVDETDIPPEIIPNDLKRIKMPHTTDFNSLNIIDNPSASGFSAPITDRGRISAGIITLLKNTWLLNQETLDGLKSETLNTTVIVFYPDFGLSLNYSLNKTWLLQADGFLYSKTGQEYYDYIYGHYSKKTITLNYLTVALSFKYKLTGRNYFMHRTSMYLIAGGYISVLHQACQKINTDVENIGFEYAKYDYGI